VPSKQKISIFLILISIASAGISNLAFASHAAGKITMEGYFNIGEKRFEDGSYSYEYYLFVDENGQQVPYFLRYDNPTDELFDLSGHNVQVRGYMDSGQTVQARFVPYANVINVDSISKSEAQPRSATESGSAARAVPSTLKTIVVLSRYNGDATEPHTAAYFQDRFFDAVDSLNGYWQDTSYGAISISGGVTAGGANTAGVVNWQELPDTKAGYGAGAGAGESTRRADAIDLADPSVDFNGADNVIQNTGPQIGEPGDNGDDVDQVILVYNDEFADGNYAFAFLDPVPIVTDEGTLYVYLVHSPDTGDGFPVGINFENGVGVTAHEMGHNFEWEHTPPSFGFDTYADEWSLMSGGGADGPPGTIAFNRDQANWIPSADKITVSDGTEATFTLDILSDPSPGSNYLMGIIPFGAGGEYYTVEARKDSTFDQTPLNQFGLMIYYYNPAGHVGSPEPSAPVNVVDTTGIGDLDNTDLDLGDTYTDAVNNIRITHVSQTATTITVTVQNNPPCSPPSSGDWIIVSSCTMSSSATAPGNVIVQNNSVLTIPAGASLDIDFVNNYLLVKSGSGVLIKAGASIS